MLTDVSLTEASVEAAKLSKTTGNAHSLIEHDGDFDVVVGNVEGAYRVYVNGGKVLDQSGAKVASEKPKQTMATIKKPAAKAAPVAKPAAPVAKPATKTVTTKPAPVAAKPAAKAVTKPAPVAAKAAPVAAKPAAKVAPAKAKESKMDSQANSVVAKKPYVERPFKWIQEMINTKPTTLEMVKKALIQKEYAENTVSGVLSIVRKNTEANEKGILKLNF